MEPNRWLIYAILFSVMVIILWIAQAINRRKSERHRIIAKTGPKIDRFVDPQKAVRPDDVFLTKDKSKIKVLQWWERSGASEGVCGVCNKPVKNPDGYLIPPGMVVDSKAFLDIAVKPIMEFGMPRDKAEAEIKEQINAEKTPWLVCEDCVGLFFKA
jgi:hypothetical protein